MKDKVFQIIDKMVAGLNAVVPQDPGLRSYLRERMAGQYFSFDSRELLSEIGGKADKLYFIGSGLLMESVFDVRGDKQVLGLYGANEFRMNSDIFGASASSYYVEALPGTSGVFLFARQLPELFRRFPAFMEVLLRLCADLSLREKRHLVLLRKRGIIRVKAFYKSHPQMLPAGSLLTDGEIAAYLLLSEGALRRLRNGLIAAQHIPGLGVNRRNVRRRLV